MQWLAQNLPHATASLNCLATLLLLTGLVLIKRGDEKLHRNVMISCFAVSVVFLILYLLHKVALYQTTGSPNKRFPTDVAQTVRTVYFGILGTHLLLAMTVPVLAIAAMYQGLKDQRRKHRRIVRFAFPIWLYVSVTGVVVYWMLYWGYPSTS
ncbi:MAG: DUF420 domain-containing protein [Pirellulaceae bacterium]